jgi:hypothetical protein
MAQMHRLSKIRRLGPFLFRNICGPWVEFPDKLAGCLPSAPAQSGTPAAQFPQNIFAVKHPGWPTVPGLSK